MKKRNLVSVYTKAKYKNHQKETNDKLIKKTLKTLFCKRAAIRSLSK